MKGEKGYIQVKGLNVDRGIEERERNRLTKTKDTKKKKKSWKSAIIKVNS